jgi:hypothetical protein
MPFHFFAIAFSLFQLPPFSLMITPCHYAIIAISRRLFAGQPLSFSVFAILRHCHYFADADITPLIIFAISFQPLS